MKQTNSQHYMLTDTDICTQLGSPTPVELHTNTEIKAGGRTCSSDDRAETQACCDGKSHTSGVKKGTDQNFSNYYYCNKDVGTGDWD